MAAKKTEDGTATKKMTGRSKILPNGAKPVKGVSYDYDRETYYVTVYMGKDANGKSCNTSKTAKTLKEAVAIKKQLEAEKQRGTLQQVSRDTLAGRTKALIDYKALSLGETTVAGYQNIYKNHIAPYFKNKRIQDVTSQDLRSYIVAKQKKVSLHTVNKHLDLLNQVFDEAFKEEIITSNPMNRVARPKYKTPEKAFFTPEELVRLLQSVHNTELEVPVYLATFLGLRREEVLGLRWKDVNLENRTLRVVNVITQTGSKLVEKEPKTKKSERGSVIPEELYQVLLRAKAKKPVRRDMSKPLPPRIYVAVRDDGIPFVPNRLSEAFAAHLKKHKFKKVTFHGLRHSFTTIAHAEGVPLQEIAAALGHSTPATTTRVYTHQLTDTYEAAANAVAEKLEQTKAAQKATESSDS